MINKLKLLIAIVLLSTLGVAGAVPKVVKKAYHDTIKMFQEHVYHPFYLGGGIGYGNTDWTEITTTPGIQNDTTVSAPISATGSGVAYDAYMGYQFSPHFTVETVYTRYPTTRVGFQPSVNTYGITTLKTDTDSYSLLGKILVPFGFTGVSVYADAGATMIHRKDENITPDTSPGSIVTFHKVNRYKLGPSFGFGVATNVTQRLFAEGSFQYTTGYGKADITPAEDYVPFVYSIMFNMGVRLGSAQQKTEAEDANNTAANTIENDMYIGMGIGYGANDITGSDKSAAAKNSIKYTENSGFIVNALAGYQFNPYAAMQVEYVYMPAIRLVQGTTSDTLSSHLVAAEAKGIYPVTRKFSVFAKAGYAAIIVSDPASIDSYHATNSISWEPVVGAGLEYRIFDRVGLSTQYTGVISVNHDHPTAHLVTGGLSYYF